MLIFLVGYMGSGKTTVGKKLAGHLNFDFIDLDRFIENTFKVTIPTVFERYDETTFRKLESETLNKTFKLQNTVIATGGGTPCFYNNMELINKNGISIYLKLSTKSLFHRLINSKQKRPLIKNKSIDEIKNFIEENLKTREPYYEQAKIITKGEDITIAELAEEINNFIHKI